MKDIICISGDLASGKSKVGKLIAEKIGYDYFSAGMVFRQVAEEKGMTILELSALCEQDSSVDYMIDSRIIGIAKQQNKIVLDSRMAWYLVNGGFNVYLSVDILEAARRVFMDSSRSSERYNSLEEAAKALKFRKRTEINRYMRMYGIDIDDPNNYHLVIDTTEKTPEQVAETIIECFYNNHINRSKIDNTTPGE